MAIETVWRDYYTGYRLDDWTKPYMRSTEDNVRGDTHQCMIALTGRPWEKSWIEWQCEHSGFSCPCSYRVRPLLRMRGRCSKSSIEYRYSPKQLPGNPNNMIILGKGATRIEYNDSRGLWVLTNSKYNITGTSRATKHSYVLGKHKWEIFNDVECNQGKQYTKHLKLTGCDEMYEFTCDDG